MNKNLFEGVPMLGYVSFYIYLEFSDDTASITKSSFDFRKPITQEVVDGVVNLSAAYYAEHLGKTPTKACLVSEESYKKYCEKYPENGDELTWQDDDIFINGEKIN